MIFINLFFFVSLCLITVCQGQQSCFQTGECRDSFQITGERKQDEFACLDLCKSEPQCSWMTYFSDSGYCQLFKDCSILDAEICPECLTGQKDCLPTEPVCWISGQCQGVVDYVEQLPSAEDCLNLCNQTLGCRWFTFQSSVFECVLFKSCPTIDESCQACISGERRCIEDKSPKEMTKLLVAAGNTHDYLKSVEVVNLDESNPALTCDNLPDLPIGLDGATGALFQGTTPIICGGYNFGYYYCDCYALQNGSWNPIASLKECKQSPQSTTIRLSNRESTDDLIVTGGWMNGISSQTVESFNGETWNQNIFNSLPNPVFGHCLVKISDSILVSAGGAFDNEYPDMITDETFFFNRHSNEWSKGPKLNNPRVFHSCGAFHWDNPNTNQTERIVVAAGGYYIDPMNSTELLRLNHEGKVVGSGWTSGPALPKTSYYSTIVEFNNTLILVGGDHGVDGLHMYQLSDREGHWLEMKQILKQGRNRHLSFLVPDEVVNCH